MKGVQANGEVPEENLDDVVSEFCLELSSAYLKHYKLERVREERERRYAEEQRPSKTGGAKVCDSVLSPIFSI